jgi:chemotaxis regulatin CheY-phosphate phosphatase CheZ
LLEGTDQQIDEQIGTLNVSKKNNKVAQSIANAAKAIAKILPDVKFVVHDTDESYRKATGEQSRSQSSSGEYNNKTKTIHINASKANNRTAAHEVFHAILLNKIGSDIELQRLTKAMIDSVLKSLSKTKGSEEVVAYLEKFVSQYDDKTIFNEEKLAELFGILADNYAKLPADTKNIIQRFIDRVRKILGLKPMTDREVIDFMNTISQKVATGQEITQKDISKISTDNTISKVNKRFQADFSDSVSKLTFVYDKNGDRFKKLEKDGYITRDKSLSDFNGKYIFLHQPDAAFSGMIFKDGEVLVEGKGGVFYPIKFHEDGYFWASTDNTAKKMADDLNKVMEQNGGTIYMALTSAPSDKLMSSTTMQMLYLTSFLQKLLIKTLNLSEAQLKSALRKAANYTAIKKIDKMETLYLIKKW